MLITALLLVWPGAGSPAAASTPPAAPTPASAPIPWAERWLEPYPSPPAAAEAGGGWSLTLTPYIWTFGIEGEMSVGNTTADVDAPFDDLVENLDLALMLHTEVRKGPFAIYFDPTYGELEADADVPGPDDASLGTELVLMEFGTMYRVLDQRSESGRSRFLDVTLGGRYVRLDNELDLQTLPDQAGGVGFLDLTVGARFAMEFTEELGIFVGGDVGGFGIGSSSEFSWSAMGIAFWNIGDSTRLLFGYRALDIDYDASGDTSGDFLLSGPVLGIAFLL